MHSRTFSACRLSCRYVLFVAGDVAFTDEGKRRVQMLTEAMYIAGTRPCTCPTFGAVRVTKSSQCQCRCATCAFGTTHVRPAIAGSNSGRGVTTLPAELVHELTRRHRHPAVTAGSHHGSSRAGGSGFGWIA